MFPLVSAYPQFTQDAFASHPDITTGYSPINLPTAQVQGRGLEGVGASGVRGHSPTGVIIRDAENTARGVLLRRVVSGPCDPDLDCDHSRGNFLWQFARNRGYGSPVHRVNRAQTHRRRLGDRRA